MSEVDEARPKKRKKKKRKTPTVEEARRSLAAETRRIWIRRAWIAIVALYLPTLWLDGIGTPLRRWLPGTWVYFAQISALFTHTKSRNLDYRAEGWSCAERRWDEIDVRAYFPIDADNKENRFQRALGFYGRNRTVMRALDDYIVERWNASHPKIGGVRFVLLRTAYPKPGERAVTYKPEPLSHYAKEDQYPRYWSPKSRRAERCGYTLPPKDEEPDEAPSSAADHDRAKDLEP